MSNFTSALAIAPRMFAVLRKKEAIAHQKVAIVREKGAITPQKFATMRRKGAIVESICASKPEFYSS
ncbi:hypothetical protein [Pantanalinema sp. GBBB05]|uniref:hypothetical protein n=1 Tax=Pantanalinema sp. GBBB05 TaxID=2604139 RepID=UPI001D53907A|nr:hypothetical protein [Pantanalinema sp. GBBB05]